MYTMIQDEDLQNIIGGTTSGPVFLIDPGKTGPYLGGPIKLNFFIVLEDAFRAISLARRLHISYGQAFFMELYGFR